MSELAPTPLDALCAVARCAYGAAAVSVAIVDEQGLHYVAADGVAGRAIVGTRLLPGRGIAGFVAATGQSITVLDLAADPRFASDVAERVGYVPTSMHCVPFHDTEGDVAGVISLLDRGELPAGATPPAIEWFTQLAAALCAASNDDRRVDTALDRLDADDRERAVTVLAALVDTIRR